MTTTQQHLTRPSVHIITNRDLRNDAIALCDGSVDRMVCRLAAADHAAGFAPITHAEWMAIPAMCEAWDHWAIWDTYHDVYTDIYADHAWAAGMR